MQNPLGLRKLLQQIPQVGALEWIGLSPGRGAPIEVVSRAQVREGVGLVGDYHASSGRAPAKRQVSLLQAEHLPVIAALSGHAQVSPALLRRNLVVSGVPLMALKGQRFTIGVAGHPDTVLLEGLQSCDPCRRMELALGEGGLAAMRFHGGLRAKVLRGGWIQLGAPVALSLAP